MKRDLTAFVEPQTTTFKDEFSREVWQSTYAAPGDKSVDDTFRRVATNLASAETTPELQALWAERFYDMLTDFKGVSGGRITANAGTDWAGTTYANCYVGPLPGRDIDSIDGIYKVLVDQANTLKSEGGWGMDFSWIRPRGAFIHGVGVESPGSVRFMELFDKSSEIVTAGSGRKSTKSNAKGKIRKGAMMATLAVWHPDIVEFITAKQTQGRLSKFNMSVNCTAGFMNRVNAIEQIKAQMASIPEPTNLQESSRYWGLQRKLEELDKWDLIYPVTNTKHYKETWQGDIAAWIESGGEYEIYETSSVTKLWNLIMESTYTRNEPGVLFLDRANEYLPFAYGEKILSTNPCGEQTLAPGGVCCLGTLNLTQFVDATGKAFDLTKLSKYTGYMVRFLDNVNTLSSTPLPQYTESMRDKRRIGVGIMGWGSALIMMGVRFGSKEASVLRNQVMQTYARAAYEASIDLAEEKGHFKLCIPSQHVKGKFVQSLGLSEDYIAKMRTFGIRNSSLLSQQPNGNGSIFANVVTGGIEPAFMSEYIRTVIVPTAPKELAGLVPDFHKGEFHETDLFKFTKEGDEDILRGVWKDGTVYKIDRNRGLTREVACMDYGVRYRREKGEWDPKAPYNVTTEQLTVQEHVEDLKGFARWTDSACSKTCNIPFDYPYEDFKSLYLDVYNTGVIKGFTTYRSGTMTSVLSAAKETEDTPQTEEEIIQDEIKLPDSLPATLKTLRSEGRKWYLTVIMNEAQTRPVALFAQTNSHEKTVTASDAVERLLELAKTKGIPAKHVDDVVAKMSGDPNTTKICRVISLCLRHGVLIRNVVSALDKVECIVGTFVFHIRKYLATFIKDGEKVQDEKCMECGSDQVVYQEGCKICRSCGSSRCG